MRFGIKHLFPEKLHMIPFRGSGCAKIELDEISAIIIGRTSCISSYENRGVFLKKKLVVQWKLSLALTYIITCFANWQTWRMLLKVNGEVTVVALVLIVVRISFSQTSWYSDGPRLVIWSTNMATCLKNIKMQKYFHVSTLVHTRARDWPSGGGSGKWGGSGFSPLVGGKGLTSRGGNKRRNFWIVLAAFGGQNNPDFVKKNPGGVFPPCSSPLAHVCSSLLPSNSFVPFFLAERDKFPIAIPNNNFHFVLLRNIDYHQIPMCVCSHSFAGKRK